MMPELDPCTICGHLSYVLIISASLLRDMLALRGLAVGSGIASILYGALWPSSPLWVEIGWETVFVIVNLWQIAVIIAERHSVELSGDEQTLHADFFPGLSNVQFHKLLRAGSVGAAPRGEVLAREADSVSQLFFVVDGVVTIERAGATVACCRRGDFIGELAFLSDGVATATAVASSRVSYIAWTADELRALLGDRELEGEIDRKSVV